VKKLIKAAAVVVLALGLVTYGYLSYTTERDRAMPAADALAALESDSAVEVSLDDWLVMTPKNTPNGIGIVVYPGAHCDIRGYAPVLKEIAAAGYLVVVPEMPFDFSIFAPDRADEVRAAYPEIEHWVIAGHSLGGAMAARYAQLNQDNLAGLIVFDSYPPKSNSLADSELPILLFERVRDDGSRDQKFIDNDELFPEDVPRIMIPGGQHMYYGSFDNGVYEEPWEPGIKRQVQQRIVIEATLEGLDRVAAGLN
jgi:dienelactone hydrolase